ncbi:MAG: EamA family transporter RarD [Ignavibacteriae bacterium]|nr:MAG: EamA family transporter RarD [Ignavibacteriota bacterium]
MGQFIGRNKGVWYAIGAYVSWGILPVYWKWLHHVPAVQLLSHRIVWSFFALLIVIVVSLRWKDFQSVIRNPRILRIYLAAAVLIGINWLTYVWAVNSGHIIECSLGYYINPLFSVLIGVIFLHEHMRPRQWIPMGLAAVGVIYLSAVYGSLPWIALTLALSFGFYGLVKKIAPLGSLYGLTLETGILILPAICFLLYSDAAGSGAFLHRDPLSDILLIGAGIVTTIPLLMFASAAQRIPLSLVGILQYISPTIGLFIGIFLYQEPFTLLHMAGYGMVWAALVLYGLEGYIAHRAEIEAVNEASMNDLL